MTLYELMIKVNHYMIQGGELTDNQKRSISNQFLDGISTREQADRFYTGVKYPKNTDSDGRQMYPIYYIPPYNDGKKHKTILGQTPKTHILSANSYELEILRLLHMFAPDDPNVKTMISNTLKRLKTTCYGGNNCGVGECYDSNLIVLRFLTAVVPDDIEWIKSRIELFHNHYDEKKRPRYNNWYFGLCLSELPMTISKPYLIRYENEITEHKSTKDPIIECVINKIKLLY